MTRMILAHAAAMLITATVDCRVILQDVVSASGLLAPEFSEKPVGAEIDGRLYPVVPDSPITFKGVPIAGWGGCWDCPVNAGPPPDDRAPAVPLPGAIGLMLAGLVAIWAVKWRAG